MWSLRISIPFLPPTSNHIYVKRRTRPGQKLKGPPLTLSKDAVKFKERFKKTVVPEHLPAISQIPDDGYTVFIVQFDFYYETLVTKSWRAPTKPAKCRYKKIDVSNQVKLIEDCLRDAIAVDDLFFFGTPAYKHMDPNNPRVEILIMARDPEEFGVLPDREWVKDWVEEMGDVKGEGG